MAVRKQGMASILCLFLINASILCQYPIFEVQMLCQSLSMEEKGYSWSNYYRKMAD